MVTPGTGRPFREDDWALLRRLLIDVLPRSAPGFTWEVRRWDGWRWYRADPTWDPALERAARVWEAPDGSLLGVAHGDGAGQLAIQVDPACRHLEPRMLAWAEGVLGAQDGVGGSRLVTAVRDYDQFRGRLLAARGWRPTDDWGVTRWQRLGAEPVELRPLAVGYGLRALRAGDREDAARLATLLNEAFGRTFHVADELLVFAAHAPDFDPELHLVAEAPDGTFAAHVGVTHEPVNHLAIVEPVCTHPDHRRRGLAESLIRAGLERARQAGATLACVDTGSGEAANRLYADVGFGEVFVERTWEWRGPAA
jgi:predicted N-acetyltransferase YhbS